MKEDNKDYSWLVKADAEMNKQKPFIGRRMAAITINGKTNLYEFFMRGDVVSHKLVKPHSPETHAKVSLN